MVRYVFLSFGKNACSIFAYLPMESESLCRSNRGYVFFGCVAFGCALFYYRRKKKMSNELNPFAIWTFTAPCPIPNDVSEMLVPGETPVCAYRTIRDSAIFTNKRLIVRDAQGLTGKKVEIYTLPYSSILMYSTENAGKFLDFNAEVELWTKAGHIKINLQKGIDIRALDKVIATYLL